MDPLATVLSALLSVAESTDPNRCDLLRSFVLSTEVDATLADVLNLAIMSAIGIQ